MALITKEMIKSLIEKNNLDGFKTLFDDKKLSIKKGQLRDEKGKSIHLCLCCFQKATKEMGIFLAKSTIYFESQCDDCDEKQYRNGDALFWLLRKVCKNIE